VAQYREIALNFIRAARQEYLSAQERAHGTRRIAFAGGEELAEIALLAARETNIQVENIFDQATSKERLCALSVVRTPDSLLSVDVTVTDTCVPQATFVTAAAFHHAGAQVGADQSTAADGAIRAYADC